MKRASVRDADGWPLGDSDPKARVRLSFESSWTFETVEKSNTNNPVWNQVRHAQGSNRHTSYSLLDGT